MVIAKHVILSVVEESPVHSIVSAARALAKRIRTDASSAWRLPQHDIAVSSRSGMSNSVWKIRSYVFAILILALTLTPAPGGCRRKPVETAG